jgi:ribonuclease P protein component
MKNSHEFMRVKKEGKTEAGRYVVLSVLKDQAVRPFRFGIITSRKLGSAVKRVKLRRQFREILRAAQDQLKDGSYVVMIPRWRAVDADFSALQKDWLKTAQRAGILLTPSYSPT